MEKLPKPVFYDETRRRSRLFRRTMFSVGAFLTVAFGLTLSGIFLRSTLPGLSVAPPDSLVRPAPIAPSVGEKKATPTSKALKPSELLSLEQRKREDVASLSPLSFAFYVNWDDNSLVSLKSNYAKIDRLVPEWRHLSGADGSIVADDIDRETETLAFIKATRPDLKILPLVNNFTQDKQNWDGVMLGAMLANPKARATNIQNLLSYVRQNNFSGISIDYESLPLGAYHNLVVYMQEIFAVFHPAGLEISVNIPLGDDSFLAKDFADSSDAIILMAYDEHATGSDRAGAVASQQWFADGVAKRFLEVPSNNFVVALGGYGYDWAGNSENGDDITFQGALEKAKASSSPITFDSVLQNPYIDYSAKDGTVRHVWYLDAVTAFNEVSASLKIGNPSGFALWRLGSEDPDAWNVLSADGKLDSTVANSLQEISYGYDVSYSGQGEILRVSGVPSAGKRTLNFDAASDLITDESITTFPSGYSIERWGGDDPKKIALTFDDGPDQNFTPKILDILKQYHVPATFFIIGQNASVHPDILQREVSEGNEVGNHTYTHPNITSISTERFAVELSATERLFEGILGRKSLLFRPPYAEDVEPATPNEVAPLVTVSQLGYYTIGMHIDPSDWSQPGVDTIIQSVLQGAGDADGNIVLLHDSGGDRTQTVEALPKIIEGLQSRGFQLVTISSLMHLSTDDVLPKLSTRQRFAAWGYTSTFSIISVASFVIAFFFFIGIVLGTARFLFVGFLAMAQYIHARRMERRLARSGRRFSPSVSVVIPAYNEEKVITKTIRAILASSYSLFEIVVVDDGSSDETFARVFDISRIRPNVRVYRKENGGKSSALNFGIARTTADIIVTLDADTVFRPNTIAKLVEKFSDVRVGAVAGNAKVGNRVNILTKWQALEYITSQNLDRRAFEMINCITVVPGAVGAWRRSALLEAGGFSSDTLAEDADLTFAILRKGYRVAYADRALAYTEAPDTVQNFLKQRFRWMYGTFQTVWKHGDTFLRWRYRALGLFAVPNVLIFQILFPLISPFMDLMLVFSVFWVWWQRHSHPIDYSALYSFHDVLAFYVFFLVIDFITAALPLTLERREDWTLLLWLPLQRFFYRQLMYWIAIKSVFAAIRGILVGWNKFERKANVAEIPLDLLPNTKIPLS